MAAEKTQKLASLTLELVNIPSESRNEADITQYVSQVIKPLGLTELQCKEDYLLYITERDLSKPLVVLAGHLDTVPAQQNLPGSLEQETVNGLGASDMKGGIAVLVELARWISMEKPVLSVDLAFLFFVREELPVIESPLPELFALEPELTKADLAIVLEPTNNTIQVGCLGNLNATIRFHGEAAHSARPWTGENAIAIAIQNLPSLLEYNREEVLIDGLSFYEVLSLTQISGGVADNVIPDLVECRVNYRFSPDFSATQAIEKLTTIVGNQTELEITSVSGGAPVASRNALVKHLQIVGSLNIEPKQAWTPVAQFADAGIPAINFGPGDPVYAHKRNEQIAIASLGTSFEILKKFITSPLKLG